jgi:uncharacterized phiE125 gp8 family phage protein
MTLEPTVISGPIKEPVSVWEAASHTKADYADDNPLYDIWIAAARDYVESHAGITIHEKTLEITVDCWPRCGYIALPRATPLISVTSVTYYDTDGVSAVMSAADYIVDTDSKPGRIVLAYNAQWPSVTLRPANGIRIRYKAGIAITSPETEAPANVKHPVLMLVNAMDRNRSAETIPDRNAVAMIALNFGVNNFIERLRVEGNNF